jgi:5-methylcytosine-specific restriction endonuclease McrA
MLILSTKADKVFVEYPHRESRASYLLLRDQLVKVMIDEWEVFRNQIFDDYEAQHHTLTCHYCKRSGLVREIQDPCDRSQLKTLATIDHIVALSKGGKKYDRENCRISCSPCNNKRGNKGDTHVL